MSERYGKSCSTHCCKWHGCKYGYHKHNPRTDTLCEVVDGGVKQQGPCEYCSYEWVEYQEFLKTDPEWIKYIEQWKAEGDYI